MNKPLIQRLAERCGVMGLPIRPEHPNFFTTNKLLFELCAYLDEQAASFIQDKGAINVPPTRIELEARAPRNAWRDEEAHHWAMWDCPCCSGDGTVNDSDPCYAGWRWCNCAVKRRDAAKAQQRTRVELEAKANAERALSSQLLADKHDLTKELDALKDELENSQSERETSNRIIDRLNTELAAVRRTLSAETSREQAAYEAAKREIADLRSALVFERGWDLFRKARYEAVVEAARQITRGWGNDTSHVWLKPIVDALAALSEPAPAEPTPEAPAVDGAGLLWDLERMRECIKSHCSYDIPLAAPFVASADRIEAFIKEHTK